MSAPHQPNRRVQRRERVYWLRRFSLKHFLDLQDPRSLGAACVMVSMGLILIFGFFIAVLHHNVGYAGLFLLFGCALMFFGSLGLFFALVEWAASRFSYSRRYCGCCSFYKPAEDNYAAGVCQWGSGQGAVQRTHSCLNFRHSERAMVRDRLWQHRDLLQRLRRMGIDSEQTSSDD
ncbi:MAG TPA: hypothetical protein VH599_13805 [Ktedonobacterales bacterium]|jgi:hypothetical protein